MSEHLKPAINQPDTRARHSYPVYFPSQNPSVQEGIRNGLYDNKQIQKFLDELSPRQINRWSQGENPFLDFLSKLAREAEITNVSGKRSILIGVALMLQDMGVPVAIGRGYYDKNQNYQQVYYGVVHENVAEGQENSIVKLLKGAEFDCFRIPPIKSH